MLTIHCYNASTVMPQSLDKDITKCLLSDSSTYAETTVAAFRSKCGETKARCKCSEKTLGFTPSDPNESSLNKGACLVSILEVNPVRFPCKDCTAVEHAHPRWKCHLKKLSPQNRGGNCRDFYPSPPPNGLYIILNMNLYTPAGGICGTHVTWDDVEEVMQRELGTTAAFGPGKTASNISEAKGFISRIVLIDPDWQHKDKELPQKFIVKIVTQLALQQIADTTKKMNVDLSEEFLTVMESYLKRLHNTEVTVYSHLLKLPEGKMPLAKIYYMKKFSESNPVKGYIIMEYLDNIKPVYIYENVTPKAITEILRAKAVMEAMSLRFTPEEKQQFNEKHFNGFFGNFFTKETMGAIVAMFRQLGDSKMAEKADELEKILPDLMDLPWADQLADEIGMQRVLCHGDLWLMNILWRPDGFTAALIDYQNAHMGCPANDLVRLFTTSLSGKDRQQHWEELVEEFYGYLKEEAVGLEMPYTLDQIKESYRRFLPMGAFMSLPMAGHIFEIISKNPDEEEKRKYLDILMEKIVCLLDDILHYHKRNMKIRRGEQDV
ncbi:hypothetical protein Y032_0306g1997 [Ancylostoma ceylanicum]|uniref:CHK kinase-like domain-containing protein n=2 Tax=Ancylostoma ceylanicum TaxID=53326 RepID=A0A016S300_9BILA|nr:hypothetical protein Y032_0306g1997 [Ancylostoma ceylanicum]